MRFVRKQLKIRPRESSTKLCYHSCPKLRSFWIKIMLPTCTRRYSFPPGFNVGPTLNESSLAGFKQLACVRHVEDCFRFRSQYCLFKLKHEYPEGFRRMQSEEEFREHHLENPGRLEQSPMGSNGSRRYELSMIENSSPPMYFCFARIFS